MILLILINLFVYYSLNNACPYQELLSKKINKREITNDINSLQNFSSYEEYERSLLNYKKSGPICNPAYKYRSFTGMCNNLIYPTMGMALTKFERILPPLYSDGIYQARLASDDNDLPSTRKLSTTFFPDDNNEDSDASLFVMQFGQLLTHDIALSNPKNSLDCCKMNKTDENYLKYCLPIIIPNDDPFYAPFNITCTNFARTENTYMMGIKREPAEQMNSVTHMIDGSQIYGSTNARAQSLRKLENGEFATDTTPDGRKFLLNTTVFSCFNSDVCFLAGDGRVNQNPQLSILQVLFMREHNRIAKELSGINPSWTDQILYEEARAIVISQIQHIVYQDLLPYYIGDTLMKKYNLYPNTRIYKYNPLIKLKTINSFTTAAFRIFHSNIQGTIKRYNYIPQETGDVNISDYLDSPEIIQTGNNFDEYLLGLAIQPMQKVDKFYTKEMTEKLFKHENIYGIDLEAFDIQRGRDHGLPTYIQALKACTGKTIHSFSQLYTIIKREELEKMRNIYKSVNDIDLFIGGNFEVKKGNQRLGPTFKCLIAQQFYKYKFGDRFWYEVKAQPHSLTSDQLNEIRKSSLSRIICDNSDNIRRITKNVFSLPGRKNPLVDCNEIDSIDLSKWADNP